MGPLSHRILCTYWYRLAVVDHTGGYYDKAFNGFRNMTQGNPLSPTIFNVVVDTVVHHWVSLVAEG